MICNFHWNFDMKFFDFFYLFRRILFLFYFILLYIWISNSLRFFLLFLYWLLRKFYGFFFFIMNRKSNSLYLILNYLNFLNLFLFNRNSFYYQRMNTCIINIISDKFDRLIIITVWIRFVNFFILDLDLRNFVHTLKNVFVFLLFLYIFIDFFNKHLLEIIAKISFILFWNKLLKKSWIFDVNFVGVFVI